MTERQTYTGSKPITHPSPAAGAASTAAPAVGFVEPGHLFTHLAGFDAAGSAPSSRPASEGDRKAAGSAANDYDTIVIGAGQAGLSVGYYLARQGVRFLILDGDARVGDVWRKRWDSLRLFTARRWDGLAGMPFPGRRDVFPTKDEMGDYLESYAARFNLPVQTNARVTRVARRDGRYLVCANGREYTADHVVVAMSSYQRPRVPAFARELDPKIVQLHSSDYRNLSQLREGPTLIVGAGNSGTEIALEVSRQHPTWMAGRHPGHLPFRIDGFWGRLFCVRLVLRVLFHRVLTVKTPIGRLARPKMLQRGTPLIRVKPWQLVAAGIERVPRIAGVRAGLPLMDDGRVLSPANIVWCTGFDAGLSFIELPVFDDDGEPRHASGVVPGEPGLYFVGQHFLHSMSSGMIHGVGRDAERIAGVIAQRRTDVARSGAPRAAVA